MVLDEWQRLEAPAEARLRGLNFEDRAIERASRSLTEHGFLRIQENRHGLSIQARQHVGVVQVGPLQIIVRPKLPPRDLWHILMYGLGLDTVERQLPVDIKLPEAEFVDLLALALLAEADTLWRRGLRRGYQSRNEWLASPRGRIDMARLAAAAPLTEAALPCRHHVLSMDTLENQVVRAGLALASRMAHSLSVRAALVQAERRWGEVCGQVPLNGARLRQVERARNRLTSAYAPAHRLVALLHEGLALPDTLEDIAPGKATIPGFLWNMALLFERFVTRFLQEHLREEEVSSQTSLHGLYRVVQPSSGIGVPLPRPDMLVRRNKKVVAVLDTKYRDLAARGITREILYQMSVYAVAYAGGQEAAPVPAIALYPRETSHEDIIYAFRHGLHGGESPIILRAVDWAEASRALRAQASQADLQRIARSWVRS
ncbi:McrC family protein [Hyalangium gracile]|uniref:McrC family protein n=1 Tax=Hyalangium gracile TaxID=394092 RepID=UPI001CCDC654|nr:McrC family protein [Hyalangium gracile]